MILNPANNLNKSPFSVNKECLNIVLCYKPRLKGYFCMHSILRFKDFDKYLWINVGHSSGLKSLLYPRNLQKNGF